MKRKLINPYCKDCRLCEYVSENKVRHFVTLSTN
jgi:hypothetical protein